MALRNGLLVHGPTHWAAAVRDRDGEIRVASGRKPRVARRRRACRAFAAWPGWARPSPSSRWSSARCREARLPFQDAGVPPPGRGRRRRGHDAAPARPAESRARRRPRASPWPRRCSPSRAGSWPPTTASSTRRSPPTRTTPATPPRPRRSTIAVARTSLPRCSPPTSPGPRCCARSSSAGPGGQRGRRPGLDGRRRRGLRVGRASLRDAPARALQPARIRAPAHMGTREPDEPQLEVGRAALGEILRVETGAA